MIYTIENANYRAEISSTGAELQSVFAKGPGFDCMWYGDPAVWARRAPLLFPIVGRLIDDRYTLDGKEYSIPQHGFVRTMEFSLVERKEDRVRLSLKSTAETLEKYPFSFTLISDYSLSQNGLTVTRTVENNTTKLMPYSLGEHFGFRIPFFPGENNLDYRLTFPQAETAPWYPLTPKHHMAEPEPFLNNTKEIPIKADLFDRDALVFLGLKSKKVSLGKNGGKATLNFHYDDYSVIAFWSKPGAKVPYVCIEPWNGHDMPENFKDKDIFKKPGILTLEGGKSRSSSCRIEVV